MNNIFIIGSILGLKNRLDNNQYKLLEYIKEKSKFKITFFEGNNIEEIKKKIDDKTILYIICCNPSWINEFKNIKIYDLWDLYCVCKYKCKGTTDKCGFNPIKKYLNNYKYNYIFTRFDTYITQNQLLNYKKFKFGYFIDPNLFNDWKLNKKYDILLYGSIYHQSYPFRNRLYSILNKSKIWNVKIIYYSAKLRNQKKLVSGKELSKLINQSWITISTKATIDALLQKYYEIVMSKSVVCGDYPDLDEEQFLKDNMILINNTMSDEEIINKIESYLQNKKKLTEMADKCYKYFMNKYTYEHGVKYFDKLIDVIL